MRYFPKTREEIIGIFNRHLAMVSLLLDRRMENYQLFIQKNSTIFCLALAALFAVRFAVAGPIVKEIASNEMLRSIPEGPAKIFKDQKFIWTEYCPDNTCDVVRSKSTAPVKKFGDLAAAYYYYFSKYEHLEKWQSNPTLAKSIDENLMSTDRATCQSLAAKELARCRLELLSHQSGLQIIFVRFDEGRRSKIVIPTNEALR